MLYIFPGTNYVCGDDTILVVQHHPFLVQSNITINQSVSQIEGGDWRTSYVQQEATPATHNVNKKSVISKVVDNKL